MSINDKAPHVNRDAARACDRGPCHKQRGHTGRCNPGGDAWPEDQQREAVAAVEELARIAEDYVPGDPDEIGPLVATILAALSALAPVRDWDAITLTPVSFSPAPAEHPAPVQPIPESMRGAIDISDDDEPLRTVRMVPVDDVPPDPLNFQSGSNLEPAGSSVDTITIPRPHVPYGPTHVTPEEADAEYLRSAVRNIEHLDHGSRLWGSNLTATIIRLLNDAADAIETKKEAPRG